MTNAITIQDTASTTVVGQDGQAIITGTPTPSSFVAIPVTGSGALAFELAGAWTGTIEAEGTLDNVEWVPTDFITVGLNNVHTSVTANGQYKVNGAGFKQIRLRAPAAVTGQANVTYLGVVTSDFQHVAQQGNVDAPASLVTLSSTVAGTYNSPDLTNTNGRGVSVLVNLTTMTAASVVVTLQGKDIASGTYYTLLASAAKTATGATLLTVYPGAPATANVSANAPLPKTWRVSVAVSNNSGTAAVTGTIGASVSV